jgi:hypothetical protein
LIPEGNGENIGVPSSFLAARKQRLRSALDPLPRFLSIRSLAILVTMLVGGIAISVHEYLESGRVVRAATPVHAGSQAQPQILRTCESRSASASLPDEHTPASPDGVPTCDRPIEMQPSEDATPGMWIPDSSTTGS